MRPGAIGRPLRSVACSWTGRSSSATTGSFSVAGFSIRFSTSSIRSTYSRFSSGTHHIFFPPRLQLMATQQPPDRFLADRCDDALSRHLLRQQNDRPARPSRRWWATGERHDRGLAPRVEFLRRLGTWVLAQGGFETALQIASANSANLTRVSPRSVGRSLHRPALVEEFEDPHSSPPSDRQSLSTRPHRR